MRDCRVEAIGAAPAASAPIVERDIFGESRDGQIVERYTIANARVRIQAITYGAIITSLVVPDRFGNLGDVVLGCDTLQDYEAQAAYLGAVVGRHANRIARARVTIDGRVHHLAANDGAHHLHGGPSGFHARVWKGLPFRGGTCAGVRFSRLSPAGEEGYPGALFVAVNYSLDTSGVVTITYESTTTEPTIVNLTQHSYFNLSAGMSRDILDHILRIDASRYTPVDADLIPTGVIASVRGTPFDLTTPCAIGQRIDANDMQLKYGGGFDHNWVLDAREGSGTAAFVYEPRSGRTLEIRTTEPGLQFYSGNRLNVRRGRGGQPYEARAGFCLETQHFPDSPSHPHFPTTLVSPSRVQRSQTTWTFGTSSARP